MMMFLPSVTNAMIEWSLDFVEAKGLVEGESIKLNDFGSTRFLMPTAKTHSVPVLLTVDYASEVRAGDTQDARQYYLLFPACIISVPKGVSCARCVCEA